ncbi:MAG: hypothetical protein M3Q05_02370 [Bacteroidota bacterium]|nr:hypothetical protein [Bacteroidota bacterium]
MKTSKISFYTLCLLWLFFTACSKEDSKDIAPINKKSPDLQQPANMHQRSISILDNDGKQNATLRFSSTSKELLENMPLNDFTFKIVETPATVLNKVEGIDPSGASTSEFGKMNFSNKLARKGGSTLTPDPKSVIWVDLISKDKFQTKKEALSIEIESKKPEIQSNARTQWLVPEGTQLFFHGEYDWYRIQIDNLSDNALDVSFWYDSCDGEICSTNGMTGTFSNYSGYSWTLYSGGWAWYKNCNKAVGALITVAPYTYYHYRWTAWYNCEI